MRLEALDLDKLENCTSNNRWGAGGERDRHLYRDDRYWYKIWGPRFLELSPYVEDGKFFKHKIPLKKPHGFEVGLFTREISSAFECFLYDENEVVRGYITKAGKKTSDIGSGFIDAVFRACVGCGWIYGDFCYNNVVEIDGNLSLIDFDTDLTKLDMLDVEFEKTKGALRSHVFSEFREMIMSLETDAVSDLSRDGQVI